ncbi:MAG: hypothetical protein ACT4QE_01740 [Anaerolineales bacterium]
MKRLILATLSFSGLIAVFTVAGLVVAMNADYTPWRYPGVIRVVSERFNLLSADKGHISQAGVYQTDADVTSVWRWYARQFNVEPEYGINPNPCMRLTTARHYAFVRHTVEVTLCSVRRGTRVYFDQTVFLRPEFSTR